MEFSMTFFLCPNTSFAKIKQAQSKMLSILFEL